MVLLSALLVLEQEVSFSERLLRPSATVRLRRYCRKHTVLAGMVCEASIIGPSLAKYMTAF